MCGRVRENMCSPDFACPEATVLCIDRSDLGAFKIVQHRQVDRTGNMIQCEFCGASYIDDRVEITVENALQRGVVAFHTGLLQSKGPKGQGANESSF